ncbi:MAG: hypothetical protein LBD55_13105, partial [Treponema sp.]|nr:hypothetical protein [Treponema sp.]
YGIGDPSTGTLNKYGPIVTDNNGNFSIDMLPLGTEFVMIYESFTTEDGHHFSGGDGIYNATYRQMDTLITYKKEKVNLGNLYIFLAETGLYVTGSTAGTASDPLEPKNGQIEITFSNPVNPSSFSAEFIALDEVNMTDPNWAGPFTYIWSEENKKVALKPVKGPHNQAEPAFPYSLNSYRPIGHLRLRGAGPDGKEIMGTDQTLAVPVFTAEGISLVAIDLNPDDIPSSRVMFVYSHAIKLIFSKPVRYAQFKLGRNTGSAVNVISTPDYTIGRLPDSKAEEVFVWTGGLLDTVLDLYYGVVSANDPNDMLGLDPSTGMLTISTTAANKIQSLLRHEAATPIAEVQ